MSAQLTNAIRKFAQANITDQFTTSLVGKIGDDQTFDEARDAAILGYAKAGALISKSAKIHSTAIVINSYVGDDVVVWENATVRNSIILNGTVVGHCSEVVRSVIGSGCSLPRFNYVGASILGSGVSLGGATTFASRRLDDSVVTLRHGNLEFNTRQKKFGAIVGDASQIGFSTHVNPGTVIGKNVTVMPLIELAGEVPENTIVSRVQELHVQDRTRLTNLTRMN